MIRVQNISKVYPTRFGENLVLDDVNFELQRGERLGILGRNGAGKSTMVRLISGAERPTSGAIERNMSVSWPLAFGGAFQTTLTGVDNVRFISRIYNQDFERNLAFVRDFAELGPYLREPVRTYSSGMRARLAFAISMIIEFDCFLIDEVGAVGEARFHERCEYELFQKRSDRAMIIISHDPAYLRDHCNRWAVLHDGKLTLNDDFEVAYANFREIIGLSSPTQLPTVSFAKRTSALEAMTRLALDDDRFRMGVQQGDWARDEHDWVRAEREYAAALELHPYQGTYWAQHGHAVREQGRFADAELSYRTASALGTPIADLRPFVDYVLACQQIEPEAFVLRGLGQGPTSEQPPSFPDVCILARLLWPNSQIDMNEILRLVRTQASLDDLAEAMIAHVCFAPCRLGGDEPFTIFGDHRTWIGKALVGGHDNDSELHWLALLCYLTAPDFDLASTVDMKAKFAATEDLLADLIVLGAFSQWPKTQSLLNNLALTNNPALT